MIANYTLLTHLKELEGKFAALKSEFESFREQHTREMETTARWTYEQAIHAAEAAVYARTWRGRLGRAWKRLRGSRHT